MKIALATDHSGFEILQQLKTYLTSLGHEYLDFGPTGFDPDDDYPIFMLKAARAVANQECEKGIILGGSGQGEAMAANRVEGVRCAVFYGPVLAKLPVDVHGNVSSDPYEILSLSRQHNDANMLSLGVRFLSIEEIYQAIAKWLEVPFTREERHARRIKELDQGA